MSGNQKLLEYWREIGLISLTSERFWRKSIRKNKLQYEYIFAEAYLKELTKWDKYISLNVRLSYLKHDITEDKATCFCGKLKSRKATKFQFMLTCNIKDKEHLDYINKNRVTTRINNYGVSGTTQIKYNQENYLSLSKEVIEEKFLTEEKFVKVKEFREYINCGRVMPFRLCRKFEVEYRPRHGRSRAEEEIVTFLEEADPGIKITLNDKKTIKPLELDIHLNDKKIAIEFNGMMWHSHGTSNHSRFNKIILKPNRHLDKTKRCQGKDIDLIHIFEDEYINNQESIELLIKRKLKLEPWPKFIDKEIRWPIKYGSLPKQLQKEYKVIKTILPQVKYFYKNTFYKTSKWTQYKTEEELYDAGYRKYYDCGELILRRK